jgi:UDP-2,3-diacylglucosamine hydrolase
LATNKKIYFASDQHFGAPTIAQSKLREQKFVNWLDSIKNTADAIFLLGDLFDFWFEYKKAVPKGFVRVLGKLAELSDCGIKMHFFVGNHDLWMHDYFEKELNITVYYKPEEFSFNNKTFFIGHGDGLGPHDKGYKRMKKVFTNPVSKWLYRWLHPDLGIKLAQYEEKEWLVQYSKKILEEKHYNFFIFGHRHLPLEIKLSNNSTYINTGDWITHFSYGEFDGEQLLLKKYTE